MSWDSFLNDGAIYELSSGEIWIAWGKKSLSEEFPSRPAIYAPDFFLEDPHPWCEWANWKKISRDELIKKIPQGKPLKVDWNPLSQNDFQQSFQLSMNKINLGEIEKSVPVLFEIGHSEVSGEALSFILHRLLKLNYPFRIFGMWSSREGIIGATPELLFDFLSPFDLKTMALAGTSTSHQSGELIKDQKILREHQIVVDSLVNSLSLMGLVTVGKCSTLKLPHLEHLLTPLFLRSQIPLKFDELIRILHPTPALGVSPRLNDLSFIKELDLGFKRKRFGAPFGFYEPRGSISCLVAIRHLQWEESQVGIGTGYGLIQESDKNKEWSEILVKNQSVKSMMGLHQEL